MGLRHSQASPRQLLMCHHHPTVHPSRHAALCALQPKQVKFQRQLSGGQAQRIKARLMLVDLAGSERASLAGAGTDKQKQGSGINVGLLCERARGASLLYSGATCACGWRREHALACGRRLLWAHPALLAHAPRRPGQLHSRPGRERQHSAVPQFSAHRAAAPRSDGCRRRGWGERIARAPA